MRRDDICEPDTIVSIEIRACTLDISVDTIKKTPSLGRLNCPPSWSYGFRLCTGMKAAERKCFCNTIVMLYYHKKLINT